MFKWNGTDNRHAGGKAVAKMTLDCGAKRVVFAEGSSSIRGQGNYSSDVTEKCFSVCGYADLAKKMRATLVDLNGRGGKTWRSGVGQ